MLKVSAATTLDFIDSDAGFDRQHYAFLVTETEFDEIFGRPATGTCPTGPTRCTTTRIRSTRGTTAAGCTSTTRTGTGWIITRPYGSGGTEAQHVYPIVAPTIEPSDGPTYPQNLH